eukprot:TRINITY_DN197_c0_g1_i2.p1 TRINITY_DN197_c0_g1~~TRINITY_DN197_c0_g1_i2.p1  ORF type:complete len:131 (+),score=19.61 TRINITY_DN197_c0_g1_i2:218-610(+)
MPSLPIDLPARIPTASLNSIKFLCLDSPYNIIDKSKRTFSSNLWNGILGCLILIHWFWNFQVIAQLELWNERKSGKYEKKVYVLPKHLDEKVAALHLPKLGAKLTKLSADQAAYINVPVEGPYKPAHYRY